MSKSIVKVRHITIQNCTCASVCETLNWGAIQKHKLDNFWGYSNHPGQDNDLKIFTQDRKHEL